MTVVRCEDCPCEEPAGLTNTLQKKLRNVMKNKIKKKGVFRFFVKETSRGGVYTGGIVDNRKNAFQMSSRVDPSLIAEALAELYNLIYEQKVPAVARSKKRISMTQ